MKIVLILLALQQFVVAFQNTRPHSLSQSPKTIKCRHIEVAVSSSSEVIPTTPLKISTSNTEIVNGLRLLYSVTSQNVNAKVFQNTDGPTIRSYVKALLVLNSTDDSAVDPNVMFDVLEESMRWYLDAGGRTSKIEISAPSNIIPFISSMGFSPLDDVEQTINSNSFHPESSRFRCCASSFKQHCLSRLRVGKAHTLNDVIGRLCHDLGDVKGAIEAYTSALLVNANSAATFRNLGSAYHAKGDMQMAFASYQQAIQIDPCDFATKDWIDAAEHSQTCYEYYLANLDPTDSSVLTRLGNLLVREHKSEKAVDVYNRILNIDDTLHNVWFNKAHAEIKIGDTHAAAESLRRTLQLDPTITAASHMLKALSEDIALSTSSSDDDYIRDLFNGYAQVYDDHGKKLLYSAPRVIRQELAKLYRARMDSQHIALGGNEPVEIVSGPAAQATAAVTVTPQIQSQPGASFVASEALAPFAEAETGKAVDSSCSSYKSFMDSSLDILDLGCGTGLAGAWLKDYARSLVGVDLSEEMVSVARKKMLYSALTVLPINTFLADCKDTYDVVVAADVLSYIGDLANTFAQATAVLRSGGYFVFTVEAVSPESASGRGYRLLQTGRFGYSRSYIDALISELGGGYSVAMSREFSPRLDAGDPVPGYLYIVEKSK